MTMLLPYLAFGLALGPALPLDAQSPRDQLFPTPGSCYSREYSAAHLASHPAQRVTSMALTPDQQAAAGPQLQLWIIATVRTMPGKLEALAYCENSTTDMLDCAMEGDAGGFTISRAKAGAVLMTVSSEGMSFEGETGFVRLEKTRGDDRSFLLQQTLDCR